MLDLEVLDVAFGGKGIAKVPTEDGDFTVFIPNAIAGQKVRARVSLCKRRHAEAKITAVLRRAPEEREVPYQAIPGAPYITLPLEVQRQLKERTTLEVYRRIGEQDDIETLYEGWVDSPLPFHYRNKMEYSFSAIGRGPDADPEAEFGDGFHLGSRPAERGGPWRTSMPTAACLMPRWKTCSRHPPVAGGHGASGLACAPPRGVLPVFGGAQKPGRRPFADQPGHHLQRIGGIRCPGFWSVASVTVGRKAGGVHPHAQ